MEKQKLTPEELLLKAQTACGAPHKIESEVLELKGHLLKYVGTIVHKNTEVAAAWFPDGRLMDVGDELSLDDLRADYRLIIVRSF